MNKAFPRIPQTEVSIITVHLAEPPGYGIHENDADKFLEALKEIRFYWDLEGQTGWMPPDPHAYFLTPEPPEEQGGPISYHLYVSFSVPRDIPYPLEEFAAACQVMLYSVWNRYARAIQEA